MQRQRLLLITCSQPRRSSNDDIFNLFGPSLRKEGRVFHFRLAQNALPPPSRLDPPFPISNFMILKFGGMLAMLNEAKPLPITHMRNYLRFFVSSSTTTVLPSRHFCSQWFAKQITDRFHLLDFALLDTLVMAYCNFIKRAAKNHCVRPSVHSEGGFFHSEVARSPADLAHIHISIS